MKYHALFSSKDTREKKILLSAAILFSAYRVNKTRAPHAGANAQLQLLLENSKLIKGNVKKILRITSPTGMDSTFDSKQLV